MGSGNILYILFECSRDLEPKCQCRREKQEGRREKKRRMRRTRRRINWDSSASELLTPTISHWPRQGALRLNGLKEACTHFPHRNGDTNALKIKNELNKPHSGASHQLCAPVPMCFNRFFLLPHSGPGRHWVWSRAKHLATFSLSLTRQRETTLSFPLLRHYRDATSTMHICQNQAGSSEMYTHRLSTFDLFSQREKGSTESKNQERLTL